MTKLDLAALWTLTSTLAFALGCARAEGGAGEPCMCDSCSIVSGTYVCDMGLVCNTGASPYTCEEPNSVPSGGACGEDANCAAGLFCSGSVCTTQIGEGGDCSGDPDQCAPGLECTKACGSARCAPPGSPCPDAGT